MASLGDAYGGRPALSDRRRLYAGTGLLLVGTFVAAVGFVNVAAEALASAGMGTTEAFQAAVALAGVAVPTLFAGSLLLLPADRPLRIAAGTGVTVAVLSVALFLFTVPAGALVPPVRVPVGVVALFVIGTAVAVWSPLAAVAAVVIEREEDSPSPTARRVASGRPADHGSNAALPGSMPADGGRDDEDLQFLLDDDRKER